LFNEEQNSFQPGWVNQTTKNFSSSILNAFIYKSGDELNDYIYVGDYGTYSSGGYVYEFRGSLSEICQNVSELHQLKWIDQYTRAIIIQMSLYNPNIGMFISVTFLIEFLSSGKIFSSSRFEPFNIQSLIFSINKNLLIIFLLGFISLNYLIIIIIYILFIIYFIIKEIQSLFHLKFSYFYQLWSLINISIIICSWAGVGIYIWRYYEAQRIGTLFQETNGYAYVNLQLASYINYVFNILLGFCCFFGTIKLLNFCRFSRRLSIFNDTLKHAGKNLICFMFMFMIIFMAFLSLFYQLFISKVLSCSTLLRTTVMLFQMIILKFDVNNLYKANAILGPICSCLFIFFAVFICMNMFTSIIINSFRTVKKNIKLTGNEDHQIFIYMIRKFLREIGIIKLNKLEYQEECDVQMKPQYYDPIESFPLVTDQLMELLYQVNICFF
jgi:polycystin 1L2